MENQIRNVEINGTSPKEDVLAALTGVWSRSNKNGWLVIHLSNRFELWQRWCSEAGSILLPREAEITLMAKVYNNDGSTQGKVVKIGDEGIKVSMPCYIEILVAKP